MAATDAIRLYIPGEWISVRQVELPDVARADTDYSARLTARRVEPDRIPAENRPATGNRSRIRLTQHMRNIAQQKAGETASPALPSRRTGGPSLVG